MTGNMVGYIVTQPYNGADPQECGSLFALRGMRVQQVWRSSFNNRSFPWHVVGCLIMLSDPILTVREFWRVKHVQ